MTLNPSAQKIAGQPPVETVCDLLATQQVFVKAVSAGGESGVNPPKLTQVIVASLKLWASDNQGKR